MRRLLHPEKGIFPVINRVEALSDGIFAIVMTLLVLDISLSTIADVSGQAELIQGLFELAPKFISYAISFMVLGELWHQHYVAFQHIKRSDNLLVWINIIGLMFVALIPFSTSIFSEFNKSDMGNIPFVIYAVNALMIIIMRIILLTYASRHQTLLDSDADADILKRMNFVTIMAAFIFVLAIGISFASVIAAYCMFPIMVVFIIVVPRIIEGVK